MSEALHDLFFSGALKEGGSWGGPACTASVPLHIHVIEIFAWNSIFFFLYLIFNVSTRLKNLVYRTRIAASKQLTSSTLWKFLDRILLIIHILMWLQVLFYKINKKSLVNLFQPCHLCLIFNSMVLITKPDIGCIVTILTLPLITGGIIAILFPDTTGLDQPFERLGFWIQHYLITIMPFYLMSRNNFLATKLTTLETTLLSNWLIGPLHWIFYEVKNNKIYIYILYKYKYKY